jgi:energy-coupling factor transporter ATP-binding protein EcfA2
LSAGQRRRVELAVLHARQPELWLLDEPHTGLDPEARTTLAAMVGHAIDGGATVLVASHEDVDAMPSVQRVVSLAGGRVVDDRRVRAAQRAPLVMAEPAVVPGGVHVA